MMADPQPLQFRLRSLLGITVAVALLFATLRWLGVPPQASLIVLVVLTVSLAAAVGLVAVIAHSGTGPPEDRD
jgi:hypothetical protein